MGRSARDRTLRGPTATWQPAEIFIALELEQPAWRELLRPYGSPTSPDPPQHWPFPASRQLLNHLQALLRPLSQVHQVEKPPARLCLHAIKHGRDPLFERLGAVLAARDVVPCGLEGSQGRRKDAMASVVDVVDDGWRRYTKEEETGSDVVGTWATIWALTSAVAAPFSQTCGRRRHMDTSIRMDVRMCDLVLLLLLLLLASLSRTNTTPVSLPGAFARCFPFPCTPEVYILSRAYICFLVFPGLLIEHYSRPGKMRAVCANRVS